MFRTDWLARGLFFASAFLLSFFLGATLVFLNKPPAQQLRYLHSVFVDFGKFGYSYFFDKPEGHIEFSRFSTQTKDVSGNPKAMPGVVFLTGLFGNELGVRLLNNDGEVVYSWPVNFFTVRPEGMKYKFHALIHGSLLYPNGDIVVNLDGRGLYRISRCGEVIWQNNDKSHHSIFVDHEGFIWTPIGGGGIAFGKFDPETGKILLRIDLKEVLILGSLEGVAPIHAGGWHLNDVEVLHPDLASAFPELNAGDIMVSFRDTNQLWILDGKSHELKWWRTGPATGQHDPDFQPDGTITILDNRASTPANADNNFLGPLGGSRIIRISPGSYDYATILDSSDRLSFFTPYRGKHQILDNGNVIVAETDAGRAMEVTPDREVVWSHINWWDEDEVGWILGATKYPNSYAEFTETSCPN